MNKRISDLVLKAQTQAAKETIQNSFSYEGKVFEKFAELIVRECLSKVNEAVYAREMSGRYYPDSDGKKILKHFGVEE